jgi:hypothetical protein
VETGGLSGQDSATLELSVVFIRKNYPRVLPSHFPLWPA